MAEGRLVQQARQPAQCLGYERSRLYGTVIKAKNGGFVCSGRPKFSPVIAGLDSPAVRLCGGHGFKLGLAFQLTMTRWIMAGNRRLGQVWVGDDFPPEGKMT